MIISAFRGYSGLRDPVRRSRSLKTVGEELGEHLHFDQTNDADADIELIVRKCAARWGGIAELLEELALYADDGSPLAAEFVRLRDTVADCLPESLLSVEERRQLRRILRQGDAPPPARLRRIHQVSIPNAPVPERAPDSLLEVLWVLDEMPHDEESLPPLLICVELLRHEADRDSAGPVPGGLRRWADGVADRLDFSLHLRLRSRQDALRRFDAPPFLVAKLGESPGDERVWLNVFIQWTSDDANPLHFDDEPRPLSEVSPQLSRLLHERSELQDDDRLIIEFVLPRGLLTEPVDTWEIGMPPRQLGSSYGVVIRELGRDTRLDPAGRQNQRNKWEWVRANGECAHPESVYWHPAAHGQTLWADLIEMDERVCLVLPAAPGSAAPQTVEQLEYGLAVGMPGIIWNRRAVHPSKLESRLVDRLRATPVREHVHLVRHLRLEAQRRDADPDHPGRDLAVFWDDLDRQPPAETALTDPTTGTR